ncbi:MULTISPECIES: hypothetical protein [unclassified Virgibacillus]|uniref:hypothetical protein n=1 Tax=unclassified Virgibacillus TaxID=2620237 RepID=UPI00090CA60C|nr:MULTISPECIES: hypothetical protein [unclassified Virgibacillus]API93989.1 hypothetical protein BKP57_20465 [Virgibacillus sp. 6R]MBS7427458.1 hypothetical protein [Virgibacillus sp. 19R1-5]
MRLKIIKTVKVQWTPAYQNYYSAGDEAEPFCDEYEFYLLDNFKYCPGCGGNLNWDEYQDKRYI